MSYNIVRYSIEKGVNLLQAVRFKPNNPLFLLPLVYFLPEDMLVRCPTLCKIPRSFREVINSDDNMKIIRSNQFLNEISTATARLVFPHFGLRGWVEHYTGYCPAWKLAYATHIWAKAVDAEIGFGLQYLFNLPKDAPVPFFDEDYIRQAMKLAVRRGLDEQNWQPIIDLVKELPCDEDFEKWNTNIRKDFIRKWYHTRAKTKTVSLESCLKNEKHAIYDIPDNQPSVAENFELSERIERFKARLSAKDSEILELRVEGYTYEEIADKLGYKTHSAVVKRMRAIAKAYEKFEDEAIT